MGFHVLILGPGGDALVPSFEASGHSVAVAADVRSAMAAIEDIPALLYVVADPGTPPCDALLKSLRASADLAAIPQILVTQDAADAHLARWFRSGVVDLQPPPLDGELVNAIVGDLSTRPGAVHGRDRRALQTLMAHIRRTHRSGALTINPSSKQEGTAMMLGGELQSASYAGSTGQKALVSMLASANSWTFAEIGGPATGSGAVIPVEAEVELELDEGGGDEPIITGVEVLEQTPVGPPTALLLVDDDPELTRMFSLILTRRGFAVTTAIDGVEGYERAKAGQFDVIVADLAMPRLDGWGLLRQLRDDYQTRELPVAFLSCHEDYRDSLKALDAGAQAYLSKSVKHDALATQVRALLGPRNNVRALLAQQSRAAFKVDPVGPQWLLREVSARQLTGCLVAKDGWAAYELYFDAGAPVHATAVAGTHRAGGERAFNAFVAARGAEASFFAGQTTNERTFVEPLDELLRNAAFTLNENEHRAREALLVKARKISVNEELYRLYAQVGPKQWLETARLICEEKLPPVDVIARVDSSPVEVEETIRDLVRRGVIHLAA